MRDEVAAAPASIGQVLSTNPDHTPVRDRPWIGMGTSFWCAESISRMVPGISVQAADQWLESPGGQTAVAISQSGASAETVAAARACLVVVAVTNEPDSSLATLPQCGRVVHLGVLREQFSSSVSCTATLAALALLAGLDLQPLARTADRSGTDWLRQGADLGAALDDALDRHPAGIFWLGDGPLLGMASQAGLIASETWRRLASGMTTGSFDHGFKEAAQGSLVIALGDTARQRHLADRLAPWGVAWQAVPLPAEPLERTVAASVIIAAAVAEVAARRNLGDSFRIGAKVTASL